MPTCLFRFRSFSTFQNGHPTTSLEKKHLQNVLVGGVAHTNGQTRSRKVSIETSSVKINLNKMHHKIPQHHVTKQRLPESLVIGFLGYILLYVIAHMYMYEKQTSEL